MKIPRIIISAPKSGSGKTLISIAMMQAFSLREKKVAAFKCGPDYIDPMFHKKILKLPSKNLDLFFTDAETTKNLFCEKNESEISIIEGVMGLYDGINGISEKASTYDLAKTLRAPVILVIDAKGMARSVLAEIAGFLSLDTEKLIKGVILNKIPQTLFSLLKNEIEEKFKIKALGFFQDIKDFKIESRYLGLKLPEEISNIEENVKKAAEKLEKSVDLDSVLEIALSAPEISKSFENNIENKNQENHQKEIEREASSCQKIIKIGSENKIIAANKKENKSGKTRIAIARDEAFCFYYDDNLRLLEKAGAELVYFSPLYDEKLPENICGIVLGGGYPELFAEKLEKNSRMRESVKKAIENGTPSLAECGGFIYLHKTLETRGKKSYQMAGVIDAKAWWTGKLVRFGYVLISEKKQKFLGENKIIKGHEFHYFDSTKNGDDLIEEKTSPGKKFEAGFVSGKNWWGFAHLYYESCPEFARHFVEECKKYQLNSNEQ